MNSMSEGLYPEGSITRRVNRENVRSWEADARC